MFKEETLAEKFIKKWFWLYLFTFITAPAWYIIRSVISNDLSISDVWIIYSIIWFISLITAYNDFWFTASLQYFLPKYWIWKKYDYFKTSIFISVVIQICTWIAISLLLFFWSNFLAENYFHSSSASYVLKIFCIYFIWTSFLQVVATLFMTFQDAFYHKLIWFIRMMTTMIFTLVFFLNNSWNIETYSLAWGIGTSLSLLIAFFILIKKYWFALKKWRLNFNIDFLHKYSRYAFWTFLWSNAAFLLWRIDQQMIIYFLWAKSAGYYTNYLSLIKISWLMLWPLLWFLFPIFTEIFSKKDNKKLILIQNFLYKYFSVFALSIWAFIYTLWSIISIILYWIKFQLSWELIKYSSLFIIFNTLYIINFSIVVWMWKIKEKTKIIWIAALVNFVLNIFLINIIWMVWAIFSSIIWWIIMWYFSYRIVNINQKINFDYIFFIKNAFFIFLFMLIIHYFINDLFYLENVKRYSNLVNLILVWVCYWIYLWIINFKDIFILKREILKLKTKY